MRQAIIRSGMEALYFTGMHRLMRRSVGGVGAILTLHHVRPARPDGFQPNRLLEITPEFLDAVLTALKDAGFAFVTLDEVHRRLAERDFSGRFVCLTFDDGYRDNRDFAYPILKRHGVPFAIYVPSSFAEGHGDLWWLTLEAVIAAQPEVEVSFDRRRHRLSCRTDADKRTAFAALYWRLRALPDEAAMRAVIGEMAARYGIDAAGRCRDLCMSWREIAELAADPLVTIGAHTVNHMMLRKTTPDALRQEMAESAEAVEAVLGRRPAHFSYPVGDASAAGPREFAMARELGFKTAVTTRPGVLFPEHRDHLMALPRLSLNGEFQRLRYVDVLTSGAATALWNRFRRVNAA